MAKSKTLKKNLTIFGYILFGFILLLALLFIISKFGLFNFSYNVGGDIINLLNKEEQKTTTEQQCSLTLNPDKICVHDYTTGKVIDGINTHCWVYAYTSEWQFVYEGNTNIMGSLQESRRIDEVGTARLRAICDLNKNSVPDTGDCLTNYADLEVVNCGDNDDNNNDNDAQPTCDFLCQEVWGYDHGDDPVNGECDFGVYKVDQNLNDCCCWNDAPANVVCQSGWPIPQNQDDCYDRPGCTTDSVCVFVDAGIVGQNSCECQQMSSCETYCRYQGYSDGYCTDGISKNPCYTNVRAFGGDQYCNSGFPNLEVCCCQV